MLVYSTIIVRLGHLNHLATIWFNSRLPPTGGSEKGDPEQKGHI